jgi:[phosphatase 2A protein]-leucine-carboxy methyltransferase
MQSHFNGSSLRRPFSDESSDLASHFHAGPSSRRGGDDRDTDDAIRGTDDDAIGSKLCVAGLKGRYGIPHDPPANACACPLRSAVELGYIDDPYAGLFSKSSRFGSAARKPPLINVGTHHRTWALDKLVDEFLNSSTEDTTSASKKGKGKQIVSLGAGSDTRFWRIAVSCHGSFVAFVSD